MDNNPRPTGGRLLGTAVFALYFTLFNFAINVFMMLKDGSPVADVFVNTIIGFFFLWFICYQVAAMFAEMVKNGNRPRDEDQDQTKNNTQDQTQDQFPKSDTPDQNEIRK